MRKWMRERLSRRQKSPAPPADQPTPPPLQPAYFDAEQQPDAPPDAGSSEGDSPVPGSVEHELDQAPVSSEGSVEQPSTKSGSRDATSAGKGRRRRGGRGRGGRGREQAVAQAFAPKGAVPAEVTGTQVDEPSGEPDAEEQSSAAAQPAAAATKIPVAPTATQRPPKGIVVLAIGLPGSGKSSWFKRHNVVPLSSDMVRSLLFDDVREQR